MTTADTQSDYIEMYRRRYNYFPQTFRWHGQTFHVQTVERCWTKTSGGLLSRIRTAERLCFRVRAVALPSPADQPPQYSTFDIYQDLLANTWHLERQLGQCNAQRKP